MCTGMLHGLLQESVLGVAPSELCPQPGTDASKARTPALRSLIEHVSNRQQIMDACLSALHDRVAALYDPESQVDTASAGGSHVSQGTLPPFNDAVRQEAMAKLKIANGALCNLAEVAASAMQDTSAGSSPLSNSKTSIPEDLSARVLGPLRAELDIVRKDLQESLQSTVREDKASIQEQIARVVEDLREAQQAGLSKQAAALREELETVRGEAVSAVMNCWQQLQQKSDFVKNETSAACTSEIETKLQQVAQGLVKKLEALHAQFDAKFEQQRLKTSEALASSKAQRIEEFSKHVESLRTELKAEMSVLTSLVKESESADLHTKHKDLQHVVNVQQNLLSQHAEELEALRQEQSTGLPGVSSVLRKKLDAVCELTQMLDRKVSTPSAGIDIAASVQAYPPDIANVAKVLQKKMHSEPKDTGFTSDWPMLQEKLSALTHQVKDIGLEGDACADTASADAAATLEDSKAASDTTEVSDIGVENEACYISTPADAAAALRHGKANSEVTETTDTDSKTESVIDTVLETAEDARNAEQQGKQPVFARNSKCAGELEDTAGEPEQGLSTQCPSEVEHVESTNLQGELPTVLQKLHEAERSLAAETCAEPPEQPQSLGAYADWWQELQGEHQDLARLVHTEHAD